MRDRGWLVVALVVLGTSAFAVAEVAPVAPVPTAIPAASAPPELITEVSVIAPEPRYVAPTLRDRLGRIWAPVYLNGKGPYRLVLDTGASHSAIIARVADELALPPAGAILLHGVTGSATVPFVTVGTFVVGDMEAHDKTLPIVPDALGGADGVLGMEGLNDKRIFIDFRHDRITITHSHMARAPDGEGYATIPLTRTVNGLLMARAYVGRVRVQAIIDTGGQATVANPALAAALRGRRSTRDWQPATIIGATDDEQSGLDAPIPSVTIGPITINATYLTVSDLDIFERWHMTEEPAMLIGLDTLGLLDKLVIDYRRMELQVLTRHNPGPSIRQFP